MSNPNTPVEGDNNTNPLLVNFRIPGETYQLPSRGMFYKNGELTDDVKDGEVNVLPMTTIDEILLKTPDKLLSGDAIKDVFLHCIPQIKKPLELLSKDVDFLLACLRKLSYGEFIEIDYEHDCKNAKSNTYSISLNEFIRKTKKLDPTLDYTITLDSGTVVGLVPPRFNNVLKLYQSSQEDNVDSEELSNELLSTITSMLSSVDGTTNPDHILEWLGKIPAGWIKEISDGIEKLSDWGPDFTSDITCKDCNKVVPLGTPINPIAFFM